MEYTITRNANFNSLEISFNEKPDAATREILKAAGFRWHSLKKIWYGYGDEQTIADRLNGRTVEQEQPKTVELFTKSEQSELWEKVAQIWADGSYWLDFYKKDTALLIELENGDIVRIEKPRIETDFCFGYGYCGVSSLEESNAAHDTADSVKTDGGKYFTEQNLKDLDRQIEKLKGLDDDFVKYGKHCPNAYRSHAHYFKRYNRGAQIPTISIFSEWRQINMVDGDEFQRLTEQDEAKYLAALEKVRADFVKRLNTYLKKYGTSKLHTWAYLSD